MAATTVSGGFRGPLGHSEDGWISSRAGGGGGWSELRSSDSSYSQDFVTDLACGSSPNCCVEKGKANSSAEAKKTAARRDGRGIYRPRYPRAPMT